jgi:hypothetical protein
MGGTSQRVSNVLHSAVGWALRKRFTGHGRACCKGKLASQGSDGQPGG